MGRPRKLKSIKVILIDPSSHPRLRDDPDHPFASLPEDQRLEEVANILSKIHVETVLERTRRERESKPENPKAA